MKLRRNLLFYVVLAVAVAVGCAVEDPRYIFTAQRYDATLECLDGYRPVDAIPGDSVSVRCAPHCFTVGDDVFVTVVCPPLPGNASALDEKDPSCQAALDASRVEASCSEAEEGPEGEGGTEEDGGGDEDGGDEDADNGTDSGAPDAPAGG